MKKTLFRYIFSETCIPFLLGLVVFTFVLLMGRLLKLAEMVTGKGVPVSDVLLLIAYVIPSFCLVTIPMAFLLSVLLGFGRLSADGEITAMKASGVSLYGLLPPLLAFAFLAYTATMFITLYALPWGQMSFKNLRYELASTKGALFIRERVFNDDFPGLVIYVDRYDERSGTITGIMIHDERSKGDPSTILARSGTITTDRKERALRLQLIDGTIHQQGAKRTYRLVHFGTYDLEFRMEQSEGAKLDQRDMSLAALGKAMEKAPEKKKRALQVEYHRRFAIPFACFIFAVLGLPLAVRQNRRSGKSSGFSLSIVILLIYYIILSLGINLGEQGTLPAPLAAWLANICLLIPGIILFYRAANEQPFPTIPLPLMHRRRQQP